MRLAPITSAALSTPAAEASSPASTTPYRARGSEAALLDLHGVGFFSLRDSLTGYGRPTGYDSLANARRAAYGLSAGAESPAAGVYRQGDRYFVRALVATPAKSPHLVGDAGAAQAAAMPQLLHFEGNAAAHFAWVRDNRLELIVDGATKIWGRDAHHQPPAN